MPSAKRKQNTVYVRHRTIPLIRLAELLGGTFCAALDADEESQCRNIKINRVTDNSNTAGVGSVYVAIKGNIVDGHEHVDDAFERGASAAVVERLASLKGRPGVVVPDTRVALSKLASYFFGDPSQGLRCIGVTGTNGKTTVQWLIHAALERLDRSVLRVGTLGATGTGLTFHRETLTTPGAPLLHELLSVGVSEGCQDVVMEVSSHALSQHRVSDVAFDIAVFTNLTRDHLDYHKSEDAYFRAKCKLFTLMAEKGKGPRGAVIYNDSIWGGILTKISKDKGLSVLTYGWGENASVQIVRFGQWIGGMAVTLSYEGKEYSFESKHFIGRHNAENFAAAFATLLHAGVAAGKISEILCAIEAPSGRLEPVEMGEIGVYVDYAHTPDALRRVVSSVKEVAKGDVWVVFGCGGDRDRGKRPKMFQAVSDQNAKVVVTSDNPRTEDPEHIIADILSEGGEVAFVEVDRAKAIQLTLEQAAPGDVVLIAGKGHEQYQIVGTQKHYFSDQDQVHAFFGRKVEAAELA